MPCKHLAATFYLLAEAFDDDPFQILHWRGRSRDELLAGLRAGDDGAERRRTAGAATSAPPRRGRATCTRRLSESLDRYWLSPVPLTGKTRPVLAVEPDLLLRQLPTPGPRLGGKALVEALRPLYRRMR